MGENEKISLSNAEWRLMDFLWDKNPATIADIFVVCNQKNRQVIWCSYLEIGVLVFITHKEGVQK
mgnify:CR=1 FL=1